MGKQPMAALLIAPGPMVPKILSGEKKISIRAGTRDYIRDEKLMICCHIANWCVMATITDVHKCALRDVTARELRDDGFMTHHEALAGLQEFYPDLTLASQVTVIRWDNVQGKIIGNV